MRVAVGQFGAPTAVLNASLFGVLDSLSKAGAEVYGILGGAWGLSQGNVHPLSFARPPEWLLHTPGAALGAGRQLSFAAHAGEAVQNLRERHVDALIVMGGNGTMALGQIVERESQARGYDLQVIGIPKTIDNDIAGVDHTPGYPSAAQFVLKALCDLAIDLEAMVGFEQVRVVEVMGRRTGWLAAAAALYDDLFREVRGSSADHAGGWDVNRLSRRRVRPIVCLPERPFHLDQVLGDVQRRVREDGCTMVVVSEGVQPADGQVMFQTDHGQDKARPFMWGGVGAWLAEAIRDQTKFGVRYENLGLLQRCWSRFSVPLDVAEAVRVGREGAHKVLAGESGQMVGLVRSRQSEYHVDTVGIQLSEVAGKERVMTEDEAKLGPTFRDWLRPLLDWSMLCPHPRLTMSGMTIGE
ncbi:6-phosphofructokinase [Alicyclobacillus kakegawensis]|uniref:6-phosphofructokinase n=1 Tax=Alicyclobacillus kakegawensis TaxID=392012 RepID=UPI00082DC86F|nr:6-phosphofructokinase [Alicyclobacillus kakegawensis]